MIKKIVFNAYHNANIKKIIELNTGERIIICRDKWELVNDLSFFKSVGNLLTSRISIKEDLIIYLNYTEYKYQFYLYNEEEINLKDFRPYRKLY